MAFKDKVTLLTPDDWDLVSGYIASDSTSYYDGFPYTLGVNNSRVFTGYKYVDGDVLIIFSSKYKGKFWKIYKAYGPTDEAVADAVYQWWCVYRDETEKNIGIHNLSMGATELLKEKLKADGYKHGGVQKFYEDIYDIEDIKTMPGKPWRKLRPMINLFHRQEVVVRAEEVTDANRADVMCVLDSWIKEAKERGVVQFNQSQYRSVLQNYCGPDHPDNLSYIFYRDDTPIAVQIAHRISDLCWSHTIGFILDRDLKGLGEYTQHFLLCQVADKGITRVTDGQRTFKNVYKAKWNLVLPPPICCKMTLLGMKQDEASPFF